MIGIELEKSGLTINADYFVANTLTPFSELLPASRHQAKYVMQEQSTKATRSLFVVNFVVKEEVIPEGMNGTAFLVNGRRKRRDDDNEQRRQLFFFLGLGKRVWLDSLGNRLHDDLCSRV